MIARLIAAALFFACTAICAQTRVLDDFENLSAWQADHTDDVTANLSNVPGKIGNAMRLRFDFAGVNGYATAKRKLPLDLPDNYEFSFWIRGDAGVNSLQFKLVDESGANVWWLNRPDFAFPHEWQQIKIKKRQIGFAWGPTQDRTLKHIASIEFVVSSGQDGGKGSVDIDQLELRTLPPANPTPPKPVVTSNSEHTGMPAALAMDGDENTAWASNPRDGKEIHLDVDFGEPREFGGLVLHWAEHEGAVDYDVQFSDDAQQWRTVRSVKNGNGGIDALMLPESETRYVRLAMHRGQVGLYRLREIVVKPVEFGESSNAFFSALAKDAPRGTYPRGFTEQPYWTIVGVDGVGAPALMSEDGALEPNKGGFSIEPILQIDGNRITWADVAPTQMLADDYLPVPSVMWKSGNVELIVEAFADGKREASALLARYRVKNIGDRPQAVVLALTIRPFQVNPPAQFLNSAGGVSPIHDIELNGDTASVNDKPSVLALTHPDAFIASAYDQGSVVERLQGRIERTEQKIHDDAGFASGALLYRLTLAPGEEKEIDLAASHDWRVADDRRARRGSKCVDRARARKSGEGMARQARPRFHHRSSAGALHRRRVALERRLCAHFARRAGVAPRHARVCALVDSRWRDDRGRAAQSRQHRRGARIRRLVRAASVQQRQSAVLRRSSRFRSRSGKRQPWRTHPRHRATVPLRRRPRGAEEKLAAHRCCGQIHGRFACERNGRRESGIQRHDARVDQPRRLFVETDAFVLGRFLVADRLSRCGRYGQRTRPQGRRERIAKSRDEFRADLLASIAATTASHAIDYLPGCAELGDFDATSSTLAIAPAGELSDLSALIHATFERYWKEFDARAKGERAWKDYTPYEWRTVGSFVRLGWRDRAQAAIDFFFRSGARPRAWNQWAEVVGNDPREIRFIGDMPHIWVASDFIRSTLDLFAYDRASDHALVIGAGLPAAWIDAKDGVAISGMRTAYGALGYRIRNANGHVALHIDKGADAAGWFRVRIALRGCRECSHQWQSGADERSCACHRIGAGGCDVRCDSPTLTFGVTMRILLMLICAGLALAAENSAAAAISDSASLNGVDYRIDIPDDWNHELVVYYHGYSIDPVKFERTAVADVQSFPATALCRFAVGLLANGMGGGAGLCRYGKTAHVLHQKIRRGETHVRHRHVDGRHADGDDDRKETGDVCGCVVVVRRDRADQPLHAARLRLARRVRFLFSGPARSTRSAAGKLQAG